MSVELLATTEKPEEVCMAAAGICVGKPGSEKGLRIAILSGHESVLEHACFTFKIEGISRVLLAQLTRHRLASYSVESQRYVDSQDNDYYYPIDLFPYKDDVLEFHDRAISLYEKLRAEGVSAESARYILPQSIATNIIMTMNTRELRHFFQLRCCNRAQEEIRMLADQMFKICYKKCPNLFFDAGPGCCTGEGCRETKPCGHPRRIENGAFV